MPYHDLLEYRLLGQLEDTQFTVIVDLINGILSGAPMSYGYSNPMGYETSDFRLLCTTPPTPNPPMTDLTPPPLYQISGQVENGKIWNLAKRSTWGKV